MKENENIAADYLQKIVTSVVSHYETTTGITISDDVKSIMFDISKRAVLMTYGLVLNTIAHSDAIPVGHLEPLFNDLLEEILSPFAKLIREDNTLNQ